MPRRIQIWLNGYAERKNIKMGKTNLRYQLLQAIGESFKEGTKKREVKKEVGKDMDWRLYSYKQKDDLVDTTKSFLKFLATNYPNTKMAYQITSDMVRGFLESKQVRKSSFNHYRDRMKKLELILNHKYHLNLDFRTSEVQGINLAKDKLREVVMAENELKDAIAYKEKFGRPCGSLNGIKLCDKFGLRSDEPHRLIAGNIDLVCMEMTVIGKGKRKRILPINENDVEFLRELTKGKKPNEKICNVQGKSINKYLHEGLSACGYDKKYTDAKSGCHAIRKMVAQREYDRLRNDGKSREEALAWVNVYLGHSEDRKSLNDTYVANQW